MNFDTIQKPSFVLLDGSMGSYIGKDDKKEDSLFNKIWSAAALALPEFNERIIKAHMEYIISGSQIISTNSYAIQPNLYRKAFGDEKYEDLIVKHAKLSAELANAARNRVPSTKNVNIFGVLGPICETHQPGLFMKFWKDNGTEFCVNFYEMLAQALLDGGVDGFLIETMNCWEEAYLALEGVRKVKQNSNIRNDSLPIIVSFQGRLLNDNLEPSPEDIGPYLVREFIDYVEKHTYMNIIAFGLNCAGPEDLSKSLECIYDTLIFDNEIEKLSETTVEAFRRIMIELCVYPNLHDKRKYTNGFDISREGYVYEKRIDLVENDHQGLCDFIGQLMAEYNIGFIGGCCGCTPNGIKKIHKHFIDI